LFALKRSHILDLLGNQRRSLTAAASAYPIAKPEYSIHALIAKSVLRALLLEPCSNSGIFAHAPIVNHITLENSLILCEVVSCLAADLIGGAILPMLY